MLLIGHRGVCGLDPENTRRSFLRAVDMGLQMVELDVRRADGQLWVIHDDTVDRTSNGTGPLASLCSAQIKQLDAGLGENIPTLPEIIHLLPSNLIINIEIKESGCVELLLSTLHQNPHPVLISSFHWQELEFLRSLDPHIPIAILSDQKEPWAIAQRLSAKAVNPSLTQVDTSFVKKAHEMNLKVYPYTVKDQQDYQRLDTLGVDGCFIDNPLLVQRK